MSQPEILNQAFELGYTYTRSTGPVVGRFLTELRNRNIVGIKASDGRVVVPPMEYDPDTAEELSEFVEVGQQGEIVSFAWVKEPREAHPMDKPFAWAMIKLDGADVPMIHCVAAAARAMSPPAPGYRRSGPMKPSVSSPISAALNWCRREQP